MEELGELWNVEIELGEMIFEIFELSKVSFGMMKLGELGHIFVKFLPLCKRVS